MPSTEHTGTAGGPGVIQIYAINKAAAPWVLGLLVKTFRTTNQTAFAVDGSRIWTITPTNEEDSEAVDNFLDAALPVGGSTSAIPVRKRESGRSVGGAVAGSVDYIALVGGPVGDEGDDDVRKVTIACVNV